MKIAGLDIGTTGCKLTVFTTEGGFLERGYRDYPIKRSGREHEVDARAILESVWELLCQMAEKYPDIGGIGVTSFGETFVAADENGMRCIPRCFIRTRVEKRSALSLQRSLAGKGSFILQALIRMKCTVFPK